MQGLNFSVLETIAESIPAAVIIVEKDSAKVIFVNQRFIELTGSNPSGLSFKEYALNTAKARMLDNGPYLYEQLPLTKALLYGKTTYDQEMVIYKSDSSELTIIANAKPIIGTKGEITGAISIFADLSERKKATDALKRSEENYRHLLRYALRVLLATQQAPYCLESGSCSAHRKSSCPYPTYFSLRSSAWVTRASSWHIR
jgi:PAS domain S-box-containing protein